MGILVYVLGRSGTGKSYSMRNFKAGEIGVVNVQGKILPFKGSGSLDVVNTDNSSEIIKAIEIMAKKYKTIVVDDFQYVMANEFMRRSTERGYDKFTEIARHAWDIANKVRELPSNVIVYVMCHTDTDADGVEKLKTIGRLLDEKIVLEGMSTIVLKTAVSDGEYMFLTQNSGKDTVKSPAGMFPTYAIANDLKYVDEKIRNYYEIGNFKDDEEIEKMDQEAEKETVQKPDADGKRRRRSTARSSDTDTSGTVESNPVTDEARTDDAGSVRPVTQNASEQPKTRRRKARNAEVGETVKETEKPQETAENVLQDEGNFRSLADAAAEESAVASESVQAEAPKRRRRRRTLTEEDIKTDHTLDITDDELPF